MVTLPDLVFGFVVGGKVWDTIKDLYDGLVKGDENAAKEAMEKFNSVEDEYDFSPETREALDRLAEKLAELEKNIDSGDYDPNDGFRELAEGVGAFLDALKNAEGEPEREPIDHPPPRLRDFLDVLKALFGTAGQDPIVLDLDDDGVETLSQQEIGRASCRERV